MAKFYQFIATMIIPSFLVAGSDSVRLQYLANQPVLQTSTVHVELTHGDPHKTVPSIAHQEIQAKLTVTGDGQQQVALHPPLDLNVVIESLKVGIDARGHSVSFDSSNPEKSPLMSEVAKVIGRPVKVAVGANLAVESDSKDFVKLSRSLEQLGGFRTTNLLSELLQNLFALAGRDLHVGDEYTIQLALGADHSVPMKITYKIANITDSEVRAVIHGGFDSVEIHGDALAHKAEAKSPQHLQMSGEIDGKAVWSRKNALVYKTRIDYTYTGSLDEDGHEIPVYLRLHHEDSSKAI